jgi:hypothetical protein
MTWHTAIAAKDEFQALLATIRKARGIITHSCPCSAGFLVTYVTLGD